MTDLGRDNRLLGTLAMVDHPEVPDDVRQKLGELRQEIADRRP